VPLLLQTAIFFVVMIILLAYLSSGSLMTTEMGAFGVSIWKFGLLVIGEVGVGAAITTSITIRRNR
jgi:hypothetical protein